jgi:hypothetical protein
MFLEAFARDNDGTWQTDGCIKKDKWANGVKEGYNEGKIDVVSE